MSDLCEATRNEVILAAHATAYPFINSSLSMLNFPPRSNRR